MNETVTKRTALRLEVGDRVSVVSHRNGYADPARASEPRAEMATVTEKQQVQHDGAGRPTRETRWAIGTDQGEINCRSGQIFWAASDEEKNVTVTVKKGAGRPAAAARTAKHAQRTPLPARGESKSTADVATATRKRRKAVTGSEESPTPRPARRRAATPAPAQKAAPKRSRTAKADAGVTIPVEAPGAAKAQAFLDHALANGWKPLVVSNKYKPGESLIVQVQSADEGMLVDATWTPEGIVTALNLPTVTFKGGRTVKLRNISAARKLIDGSRVDVKKVPERGTKRAARPGRTSEKGQVADSAKRGNVPFDVDADDSETIVSALRGRVIEWRNRISDAIEEACVSPRSATVVERPNGERVVNFNDPRGGARTVNLKYLVNVK